MAMAMATDALPQDGLRGKLSIVLSLYRTLTNIHFLLVELRASSSSTSVRSTITAQITQLNLISRSGFLKFSQDHQRRLSQVPMLQEPYVNRWSASSSSYRIPEGEQVWTSIQILDAILAELLLRAKRHAENQKQIQELIQIVRGNDARLKSSMKRLSILRDRCDRLVKLGAKEIESMDQAEKNPIPYQEILAYARKLSQTTSAPPGFKLQLEDADADAVEEPGTESAKGGRSMYQNDANDNQGKAGKIPPQLQDKLPFPSESAMRRSAMNLPLLSYEEFQRAFQNGDAEDQIEDASSRDQARPMITNAQRQRAQAEEDEEGFELDLN